MTAPHDLRLKKTRLEAELYALPSDEELGKAFDEAHEKLKTLQQEATGLMKRQAANVADTWITRRLAELDLEIAVADSICNLALENSTRRAKLAHDLDLVERELYDEDQPSQDGAVWSK